MSLAENQELMRTMKELMTLLTGVEAKTEKIAADLPKTQKALGTFRQLERVAMRYLTLTRKMGLPDEATQALQILSKILVTVTMLQISVNMLSMGPIGVFGGIAGILTTVLSTAQIMEGY